MNTKERNLSNNLKGHYQEQQFFVDKIESRMTTTGIPDLLVLSPGGRQMFVELKVVEADMKIKLTPGQVSWHSKRHLRGCITPFVVLVEPENKLLVMSSRLVLSIFKEKGGKFSIEDVPDQCWFKRSKLDYALLTYVTTEQFYSSPRVYK